MLYTSFTYTEDINKDEILGSVVVMKLTVWDKKTKYLYKQLII